MYLIGLQRQTNAETTQPTIRPQAKLPCHTPWTVRPKFCSTVTSHVRGSRSKQSKTLHIMGDLTAPYIKTSMIRPTEVLTRPQRERPVSHYI